MVPRTKNSKESLYTYIQNIYIWGNNHIYIKIYTYRTIYNAILAKMLSVEQREDIKETEIVSHWRGLDVGNMYSHRQK